MPFLKPSIYLKNQKNRVPNLFLKRNNPIPLIPLPRRGFRGRHYPPPSPFKNPLRICLKELPVPMI
ncbi:MAG: hypothetical protein COW04_00025 [Deltaproteobacteria bacterium CG12_big_fil_rev_8_21_14_0_65_43_10]|nr:MAG: hypothetical protein AUK23_07370 [Deltaproteobacteria bacterium CG2_30_43_15]PIQ46821.1 MAG: hypothetical protein COW04_00025 [Deltaproteobacteria bacterium CG12_big_fil_rev_8_21_14_0_65_43_10]PIU85646.1 MAG: hypothetical protein COS67_06755 [Deltaproteobacteria bacterium CG06_land_8_20_14_3_00_44_19]PIX24551.1 MAG: hypothetical protein COZ68_06095 [Deltaproteobacteria bacterium CG_4_8_14_3_um_filter_43_13]PIZ20166.1 MAG: hypothetical protein COY50_06165 [Deltaproteobacteria bacterium C